MQPHDGHVWYDFDEHDRFYFGFDWHDYVNIDRHEHVNNDRHEHSYVDDHDWGHEHRYVDEYDRWHEHGLDDRRDDDEHRYLDLEYRRQHLRWRVDNRNDGELEHGW